MPWEVVSCAVGNHPLYITPLKGFSYWKYISIFERSETYSANDSQDNRILALKRFKKAQVFPILEFLVFACLSDLPLFICAWTHHWRYWRLHLMEQSIFTVESCWVGHVFMPVWDIYVVQSWKWVFLELGHVLSCLKLASPNTKGKIFGADNSFNAK